MTANNNNTRSDNNHTMPTEQQQTNNQPDGKLLIIAIMFLSLVSINFKINIQYYCCRSLFLFFPFNQVLRLGLGMSAVRFCTSVVRLYPPQ